MTMYAQKAYMSIVSDPKAKEKAQYNEWKKTVKPANQSTVLRAIQQGMGIN